MCIKICTFAYCVGSGTRQKGSNGYSRKGAMDMTERSIYSLYERDKRGKLTIRALIDVLDKAVAENAPVIFMCRKHTGYTGVYVAVFGIGIRNMAVWWF